VRPSASPGPLSRVGRRQPRRLTNKKRETEEIAITAAAETEILALKAASDAGRPLPDAAAEAARAKRSVAALQPAATPLHAARLRLGISQDEMLYQLGEAGECEPPARSSYQAWKAAGVRCRNGCSTLPDNLEKEGLFEAPPAEAIPTASGWHGLAVGTAIFGAIRRLGMAGEASGKSHLASTDVSQTLSHAAVVLLPKGAAHSRAVVSDTTERAPSSSYEQ